MLSRSLRMSFLDIRISVSPLPPPFLLPNQARYFNSTPQIIESSTDSFEAPPEAPPSSKANPASPSAPAPKTSSSFSSSSSSSPPPPPPSPPPASKPLSPSLTRLLPLLRSQPSHYITAHIHARPYLITRGDIVRLPFKMPHVNPGDVLRLTRASVLGSRDYTLRGAGPGAYLDERLFTCRATVLGTEGEPVRVMQKTKRRNRRVKTVRSKHKFTVLRISELRVSGEEELGG